MYVCMHVWGYKNIPGTGWRVKAHDPSDGWEVSFTYGSRSWILRQEFQQTSRDSRGCFESQQMEDSYSP